MSYKGGTLKLILFYVANVLLFAIPLAAFEVWLEKFKSGWDGEFVDPFWGKKVNIRLIDKVFEKTYVTPYHIIMFGVIMPGITVLEWLGLHWLTGQGWIMLSFGGITIIPPIFLSAVWIGNAVVEDFLWFAFNSWFGFRFPDALAKLFMGEFKWHTKWARLSPSVMLPRFYLTAPIWIVILLVAQQLIIGMSR